MKATHKHFNNGYLKMVGTAYSQLFPSISFHAFPASRIYCSIPLILGLIMRLVTYGIRMEVTV